MVQALAHTDFRGSLVLHCANREWESREPLVNFDEECARALHLQVIYLLKLALKYRAASIMFAGLSLASGNVHIETNDIARSELVLGNCLSLDGAVDDNISAIDDVTLNLVG